MCYQYHRDFRRDVQKDAAKESDERQEPRAEEKGVKFWAFPRRTREFTVEEPATVERTRERV